MQFGIAALNQVFSMCEGTITAIYGITGSNTTGLALHIARNVVINWGKVLFLGEAKELCNLNLRYINLIPGMPPKNLVRYLRGTSTNLVVIDNVYLMNPERNYVGDRERIVFLYQELKNIALKEKTAFLVTDKLTRLDPFPFLSPFIVMYCDNVFILNAESKLTLEKCRSLPIKRGTQFSMEPFCRCQQNGWDTPENEGNN